MTDSESLQTLITLLSAIPGVESAHVSHSHAEKLVWARVRCLDIAAINVLAYCAMASNSHIDVAEIESQLCYESETSKGLPCDIRFPDDDEALPTQSQIFGFFVAKTLYSRGLIEDAFLDSLELCWHVHFGRPEA